ncbi:hypothetical protein CP8484711_1134A, partial [Chlamydia psittaci 84-8471/1]
MSGFFSRVRIESPMDTTRESAEVRSSLRRASA